MVSNQWSVVRFALGYLNTDSDCLAPTFSHKGDFIIFYLITDHFFIMLRKSESTFLADGYDLLE